jgi:hypothetical protein
MLERLRRLRAEAAASMKLVCGWSKCVIPYFIRVLTLTLSRQAGPEGQV